MKHFCKYFFSFLILFAFTRLHAQDTLIANVFKSDLDNNKNSTLIDVRTPKEFAESHLENAINIDFKNPNFIDRVDSMDRNMTIYLYCLSGSRSASAAAQLKEEGFKNIKLLKGGLLAWKNEQLPTIENTTIKTDKFTKEDLQKILEAHEKVLVDFNAPWCGPCLLMSPKIKKIEKEFSDKIFVLRINVDSASELSTEMNIRSIPLLVLFENGKPTKALEGNQSLKTIRHFLQ